MSEPTVISVPLKDLAKQIMAREGIDKSPEFDNSERIEYSIRISGGRLIAEFTPIGEKKKRSIS